MTLARPRPLSGDGKEAGPVHAERVMDRTREKCSESDAGCITAECHAWCWLRQGRRHRNAPRPERSASGEPNADPGVAATARKPSLSKNQKATFKKNIEKMFQAGIGIERPKWKRPTNDRAVYGDGSESEDMKSWPIRFKGARQRLRKLGF